MGDSSKQPRRSSRKRAAAKGKPGSDGVDASEAAKPQKQMRKEQSERSASSDNVPCEDGKLRCFWARGNALMQEYHDNVWGIPCHDDRILFEFLSLEGAQAGLSWLTVLKKADNYRQAFDNFEIVKVAAYDDDKIGELCENSGIIRHPGKVRSVVSNAKLVLDIQQEFGSFDRFLWGFVDGKPIQTRCNRSTIPNTTPIAHSLSASLKKRGFKFVGPTIVYAFMQAVGMVNDHTLNCFRHKHLYKS